MLIAGWYIITLVQSRLQLTMDLLWRAVVALARPVYCCLSRRDWGGLLDKYCVTNQLRHTLYRCNPACHNPVAYNYSQTDLQISWIWNTRKTYQISELVNIHPEAAPVSFVVGLDLLGVLNEHTVPLLHVSIATQVTSAGPEFLKKA